MIGHVVTVENAEKKDIWAFFDVLEVQTIFYLNKENVCFPKKEV